MEKETNRSVTRYLDSGLTCWNKQGPYYQLKQCMFEGKSLKITLNTLVWSLQNIGILMILDKTIPSMYGIFTYLSLIFYGFSCRKTYNRPTDHGKGIQVPSCHQAGHTGRQQGLSWPRNWGSDSGTRRFETSACGRFNAPCNVWYMYLYIYHKLKPDITKHTIYMDPRFKWKRSPNSTVCPAMWFSAEHQTFWSENTSRSSLTYLPLCLRDVVPNRADLCDLLVGWLHREITRVSNTYSLTFHSGQSSSGHISFKGNMSRRTRR